MARTGQVFTKDLRIPSRQHELLGLDMGEGPERKTLIFGLVVTGLWVALCAPLLGTPTTVTFSIYFLPPVLFTFVAMLPSSRCSSRRLITELLLSVRYVGKGSEPIIKLGRRPASRPERIPLRRRLDRLTAGAQQLAGSQPPPWVAADPAAQEMSWKDKPAGRPVRVSQRTLILGQGALEARLTQRRTFTPRKTR